MVPLDRMIDTIWGDAPPARAEVSVRGYVSNLRKALAAAGRRRRRDRVPRSRATSCRSPPEAVDLHLFEQARRRGARAARGPDELPGRAAMLARGARPLRRTSARGDGRGARPRRRHARYEQRRGEAVEALTDVRLALGEHAICRPRWLRDRPPAVPGAAAGPAGPGALPLRAAGGGAAVDRRRPPPARDDVGVEPGPELRRLEAAILAHDEATLAWVPPPPPPDAARRPRPTAGARRGRSSGSAASRGGRSRRALLDRLPSRRRGPGRERRGRHRQVHAAARPASTRPSTRGRGRVGPMPRVGVPARRTGRGDGGPPGRAAVGGPAELGARRSARADASWRATGAAAGDPPRRARRLRRRAEPVVLVIDDLQWADDATLGAARVPRLPSWSSLRILLAVGVRRAGSGRAAPAPSATAWPSWRASTARCTSRWTGLGRRRRRRVDRRARTGEPPADPQSARSRRRRQRRQPVLRPRAARAARLRGTPRR